MLIIRIKVKTDMAKKEEKQYDDEGREIILARN